MTARPTRGRRGEAVTSGSPHITAHMGGRSDFPSGTALRTTVGVQTIVLEDFPDPQLARRLSPNGRVHWAVRAKAKDEAAHRIACECLLQRIVPPDAPVRLTFRWFFPTQGRHDIDNLIATAKPLIDALVLAGMLDDDDSTHVVAVTAEALYDRGRRALEIVIEEAV